MSFFMPQMWPMQWSVIFIFTSMMLFITISKTYNHKGLSQKTSLMKKKITLNLSW